VSVDRRAGRITPVNDLASHGTVTRDLSTPTRVLAVGAHPDDIEFGCGGTLAKWAAKGATIHHLVLTDGAKGSWNPAQDPSELIVQRQTEQRAAAAILGASAVEFLGHPDGELRNDQGIRREVAQAIRTIQPDVVLGHDPWRRYRLHPDHRHAGFVLTDSVVAARDLHFFADLGLPPHRPVALLLWEADEPNHVEDVAPFVDVKVEALLAHASQHESTMGIVGNESENRNAFTETIRAQLAAHGALADAAFGESLLTDI
jgi:LmbE family N-acetylglucosaminyl deacetylase